MLRPLVNHLKYLNIAPPPPEEGTPKGLASAALLLPQLTPQIVARRSPVPAEELFTTMWPPFLQQHSVLTRSQPTVFVVRGAAGCYYSNEPSHSHVGCGGHTHTSFRMPRHSAMKMKLIVSQAFVNCHRKPAALFFSSHTHN